MTTPKIDAEFIAQEFRKVQDRICEFLIQESGGQRYTEDKWNYDKGTGGGITRVWEAKTKDDPIERAGVNFSFIRGPNLAPSAAVAFKIPDNTPFAATGVSLVIHPSNPHAPTIHMNIRYFEAGERWWFGGGVDLTPYYPKVNDCIEFHQKCKSVCDQAGEDYDKHKKTCDEYFFLPHRGETRGIGGLFVENLHTDLEKNLQFVLLLGNSFNDIYRPVFGPNLKKPFTPEQRQFQLYRRGRYVEFNLLFDRGTKFGIQSNGRTESIFISLPLEAQWRYNYVPAPGSAEERVMKWFLKPQDWVNMPREEEEKEKIEILSEQQKQQQQQQQQPAAAPTTTTRSTTIGINLMVGAAGVALGFALARLYKL